MLKAFSAEERAVIIARRAKCMEGIITTIEKPVADVSITPPNNAPPKMTRTVRVQARAGMGDQFLAALKADVVPGYKKIGVTAFRARRVVYGGSRDFITLSVNISKYADLDGPELLVKALGEDGAAKFMQKASGMINRVEYLTFALQESASLIPQT